jgi:hypothetical protein
MDYLKLPARFNVYTPAFVTKPAPILFRDMAGLLASPPFQRARTLDTFKGFEVLKNGHSELRATVYTVLTIHKNGSKSVLGWSTYPIKIESEGDHV